MLEQQIYLVNKDIGLSSLRLILGDTIQDTARTMLANSELVVMLNQAATDRLELADLMGISEQQLYHITNVEAGHGLVKIGASLVPFSNRLPKDTELYRLMTTKPGE